MKLALAAAFAMVLTTSCGGSATQETELTPMQLISTYTPRVGVAVRTESRICVAIKNANLAASSPVTLVKASVPQAFFLARIKADAQDACPIQEPRDTTLSNYELMLPTGDETMLKFSPYIAVVGESGRFLLTNITVQADLDGNKETRMFRSCQASDGLVHLTVWSGTPASSTRLWEGTYQDPGHQANAAPCS